WLEMAGCERIFEVDSATLEGIDELSAYLNDDIPRLSLREAAAKQAAGIREWESWPEKE
ncbi:MAG: ethanolamine utilization protein EutP, partial [Clostridia bacterium]|nr:ethanolamine utilization protein EutP [Clostridia bacterium]